MQMLVLAPALTLAVVGCNRATAAQVPNLPSPEVSLHHFVSSVSSAQSIFFSILFLPLHSTGRVKFQIEVQRIVSELHTNSMFSEHMIYDEVALCTSEC